MVTINFGDFAGINMSNAGELNGLIMADFSSGLAFTGFRGPTQFEIENDEGTALIALFGTFTYNGKGLPSPNSVATGVQIYDEDDMANPDVNYRVYIHGFSVTGAELVDQYALGEDLPDITFLYSDERLKILGSMSNDDTLVGGSLADQILGYGGNDVLLGGAGRDVLNGMTGADRMSGNGGNDRYFVDNAGDTVIESGKGVDLVASTVTFTLSKNVENLTLLGADALDGFGNTLANAITGNNGINILQGAGGNDVLAGLGADDFLDGGDGNDLLDGGAGVDRLLGGNGNDVLVWQPDDSQIDGGAGNDTLKVSSGNLDLTAVPNDRIAETEKIDLRGGGANELKLNSSDLVALSSTTNTLVILGTGADSVNIVGAFKDQGISGGYHQYKVGQGILLVDTDITSVF